MPDSNGELSRIWTKLDSHDGRLRVVENVDSPMQRSVMRRIERDADVVRNLELANERNVEIIKGMAEDIGEIKENSRSARNMNRSAFLAALIALGTALISGIIAATSSGGPGG